MHLTSHTGIKPRYREDIAAFVPGGFAAGHFAAGRSTGEFDIGRRDPRGPRRRPQAAAAMPAMRRRRRRCCRVPDAPSRIAPRIEPVWQAPNSARARPSSISRTTSRLKDLAVAHQEGYQSVEHLKRYTTLGMGTDQGKTSNINALAIMAGLRGVDIPTAGTTTFRPPYSPRGHGRALPGAASAIISARPPLADA